jgi:hypothetical protein
VYCVIYEFKVKPSKTGEFESSWSAFTDAIYRVCGSRGSRLHKTEDPLIYVAYAQWPSKEIFERELPLSGYTQEELQARTAMKESVESVKKVYCLTVSDDKLRDI